MSYKPPPRLIFKDPIHLVAFGFGSGLAPKAPGTFGSVIGLPVFFLLFWMPAPAYFVAVLLLFMLGIWLCGDSASRLGVHDHPGIVWDEIVGMLIALAPLMDEIAMLYAPPGIDLWVWLLVAFVLFRIFDILKPPPIGWLDKKMHGGLGIMIDDVIAGVFAAIGLVLIMLITNTLVAG